jgi:hypothetical protein
MLYIQFVITQIYNEYIHILSIKYKYTLSLTTMNSRANSVVLVRQRTIPSDRRLSEKLVPTFAERGSHVVSATDPHGRIPCSSSMATKIRFSVVFKMWLVSD